MKKGYEMDFVAYVTLPFSVKWRCFIVKGTAKCKVSGTQTCEYASLKKLRADPFESEDSEEILSEPRFESWKVDDIQVSEIIESKSLKDMAEDEFIDDLTEEFLEDESNEELIEKDLNGLVLVKAKELYDKQKDDIKLVPK